MKAGDISAGLRDALAIALAVGAGYAAWWLFLRPKEEMTVKTNDGRSLTWSEMPSELQRQIETKGWLFGPMFYPETSLFLGLFADPFGRLIDMSKATPYKEPAAQWPELSAFNPNSGGGGGGRGEPRILFE